MKKNVVLAMMITMGLSLSACGNKVEETANIETVETVSNEEIVKETPTPATVSDATEPTSEGTTEATEESTEVPSTETVVATTEPSVEQTTEPTNSTTSDSSSNVSAADMETLYQENLHKWTTGTTWKASNGVELKINDANADAVKAGDAIGSPSAIWYEDPDRDPTPNSPYMDALHEFLYGTDEAYLNGKDRYNPEVVDISKLPDIPLASSKQTSVIETDESRAYKEAYDTMYGFQQTGKWEANPAVLLQFGFDGGKGIGQTVDGQGYIWTLEYNGSEWVVTIKRNLSELAWDGLHNSLRLVSPDGDAIYNAIYDDMYVGMTIPDFGTWYSISDLYGVSANSEILVTNTAGTSYTKYSFR